MMTLNFYLRVALRHATTQLDTVLSIQSTVRWRSDHHQMALQSVPTQPSFGTPDQTKVNGDHQRETTHEICCLVAESSQEMLMWTDGHF